MSDQEHAARRISFRPDRSLNSRLHSELLGGRAPANVPQRNACCEKLCVIHSFKTQYYRCSELGGAEAG